jgi:hypothetical protein
MGRSFSAGIPNGGAAETRLAWHKGSVAAAGTLVRPAII